MNILSHQDPQQPDVFSGSTQASSLRPLFASQHFKRVCFFKSGDPQFSGHWVIINSRTFRTFDALLDALSNKVPLPFGVRTIATPKGTHTIRSLDDLRHGGSYVCSDQRKVKPLNLDVINQRHVPWNSTRPTSAGHQGRRGLIRQLVKKNEVGRMAKIVVFKNRDPSTKRVVVLQRRTATTFEALLEYLSQVMQFPVVKLYTADGRRVEGLPALILCSGVIVAAGNEPFQQANFNLRTSTSHSQPSNSVTSESTEPIKTQPVPISSRPSSRNYSLASERHFVNQINKSLKGSHSNENEVEIGSMQSMNNQALESEEIDKCDFMSGVEEKNHLIIPSNDEVEKSFRVNQDGSMTVEMKVRLTIKQEEMIHWTTTLSRACVNSQEMAAFSQPVSSYNSPDRKDNNSNRTRESNIDRYESKDENTHSYKPIKLNKDREHHRACATSKSLENPKACFRRLPTPGPRRVRRKKTSVKNIKNQSQTEVQETRVGTYSHLENTAEGEQSERYCVVSHSSSSSTIPVPKPRRKNLGAAKHNKTHSSLSGMSEVLQLHNKGKEITETVMHIHHSQDTCENYLARKWAEKDRFKFMSKELRKPNATEAGSQSSSNDCKTNLTKFSGSSGSGSSSSNKILSLVSGKSETLQTKRTFTVYENRARCEFSDTRVKTSTKESSENKRILSKTKKAQKSERSNKHRRDKKQRGSVSKKKEGQSPENVNASHSKMLMDLSKNINFRHNDMLRPYMEDKTDIIPLSHSVPSKSLTKQRSVNSSITKSPKKSKELSESVSMPVFYASSPCNVLQYVENWMEKNHPESVPYMDELNSHESRARFQIESEFSDISEMRSESDIYNLDRKPESQQLVQIRSEGHSAETQNLGRFSKSLPSVRMHTDKQDIHTRMNKSLEDLVPKWPDAGSESSPNTQLNPWSGTKLVLEQLCSPTKCGSKASSHSCQSSLKLKKKSSSLPDFSLHLASVFGSSSKTLLSFLIMMTLRDGTAIFANATNSGSNPETIQVMQSIQKLASIKDEEELKASLVSLHSSVSAQLKKNWRDFQEKNYIKENPLLSPRQLEQEFALDVNSEKGAQDKGDPFHIKEVMKELNLCEEISLLVRGDLTNSDRGNPTMQQSGHENQISNSVLENEEVRLKDDLGGLLEENGRYLDEKAIDDIINTMPAELSKNSEKIQILKSTSHKTALLGKEVVIKESDRGGNVQITKTTNQKGLVEIVYDVKTNQERYINKEFCKAEFSEDKQMMDHVQMVKEKYTKHEISLVDAIYMPDYCPSNLENKMEWQRCVGCMQSESELLIPTSETTNSEEINDKFSERGDCPDSFAGCGIKLKKENHDCETTKHAEKPDMISVDSETETETAHRPNNGTIRTEKKNALKNIARSEASSFSADETDPYSNNDNGPWEVESNTDNEEPISSTSECKNPAAKPHNYSMTNQKDEKSDYYKSASCTWQKSKTEHEFQKSEEENVTKRQGHNTNENDEVDEDEDFDSDPNCPLYLHQDGEYSDHSESSNSQEALAELNLQPLDQKMFIKSLINPAEEKENETHKLDIKLRNAVDTDNDLDSQSHHGYLGDPSIADFLMRESWKSEDKHKAQSDDSTETEKADMDHECHCGHPTVLPQQLLDFVNLALMSSALIFTYDSNGFLRLEPDRGKSRVMSLSKSSVDSLYSRRCLPSPNTSDVSDYRPDTSDSGESPSQVSTDLFTESGEDEAEKMFIYQDNVKQISENINREVTPLDNSSKKLYPNAKQIASPVYSNSSGSFGNTKLAQCLAFHTKTDSEEGILIDKGRWLLKENHLIRKSPPVQMGMYENVDTTSFDTGHTSDDAPCIPCGTQQSQLVVISSSELEDMTKPSTPKCNYFNMVHSSDSDPFLDNQSITSNKGRGFTRKSKEVSPLGETARKKNGSLYSFSSVEFKLAAGKVHPADSPASRVVEKSVRSQRLRCSPPHEEESVEGLSLRCGQHCPIL